MLIVIAGILSDNERKQASSSHFSGLKILNRNHHYHMNPFKNEHWEI